MVTSEILINREENGRIKIRFLFTNLLGQTYQYDAYVPLGTDVNALLLEKEAFYDQLDKEREIDSHLQQMLIGLELPIAGETDPYYFHNGSTWERNTFNFCTFEESYVQNMKYLLSEDSMFYVGCIVNTWDRATSLGESGSLLGLGVPDRNKISGDVANYKTCLATFNDYLPHYDNDGNFIS